MSYFEFEVWSSEKVYYVYHDPGVLCFLLVYKIPLVFLSIAGNLNKNEGISHDDVCFGILIKVRRT